MTEQPARTKSNLVADIKQNWTRLAGLLGGLTDAQLTTFRDAEGWAVGDHVLHLAQWERSAMFFLQGRPRHEALGVDEALYLEGSDTAINAVMYQHTQQILPGEALRRLSDTHHQLLALLEPLTDADLQKRYQEYLPSEPGAEGNTTAFPVIASNSSEHYVEHLGWILTLVDRPTLIHQRVEAARAGVNPTVICRMPSGWAVLADSQFLRGYSILLADPVAQDLNALEPQRRADFLRDMAILGDALLEVTGAYRINYEILGNLDAALHAHVFPRYLTEPEGRRRAPAFQYDQAYRNSAKFDLARDKELMRQIAHAVQRRQPGKR
jgi:diadenosine tetraphosphate (Ap4A) HIT family hydrolase